MANEVILYDLGSRNNGGCWSLNPWKARAALNYKGIPYKTEFLQFQEVAPTLKKAGLSPNKEGHAYSSPAVRLPDGTYVMESLEIAHALEKLQPEPSLHLDSPYIERSRTAVGKFFGPTFSVLITRVPEDLLHEGAEQKYFYETREKSWGQPLQSVPKDKDAVEAAWAKAQLGADELVALLKENQGPYVLGDTPSFADFVIGGMWRFWERLEHDGDTAGRALKLDPSLQEHWSAIQKWFERSKE